MARGGVAKFERDDVLNGWQITYTNGVSKFIPFSDTVHMFLDSGEFEIPDEESNLIKHAREELYRIGEEEGIKKSYLEMIQIFADMHHSGGSGSHFIAVLNALLNFENLTPLTDDPEEWHEVGKDMWQNRRRGEAFSHNGGVTYYLNSEGAHSGNPWPQHVSQPKDVRE